jgi:hypothetical protein
MMKVVENKNLMALTMDEYYQVYFSPYFYLDMAEDHPELYEYVV